MSADIQLSCLIWEPAYNNFNPQYSARLRLLVSEEH